MITLRAASAATFMLPSVTVHGCVAAFLYSLLSRVSAHGNRARRMLYYSR
jgi:hypothetical protein